MLKRTGYGYGYYRCYYFSGVLPAHNRLIRVSFHIESWEIRSRLWAGADLLYFERSFRYGRHYEAGLYP